MFLRASTAVLNDGAVLILHPPAEGIHPVAECLERLGSVIYAQSLSPIDRWCRINPFNRRIVWGPCGNLAEKLKAVPIRIVVSANLGMGATNNLISAEKADASLILLANAVMGKQDPCALLRTMSEVARKVPVIRGRYCNVEETAHAISSIMHDGSIEKLCKRCGGW